MKDLRTIAACLLLTGASARAQSIDHGAPNASYPVTEVFEIIGAIDGPQAPFEHGTSAMHDGFLVIPFADNISNGGFAFYDISDPYAPVHVNTIFDPDTREGHSMGFSYRRDALLAVTQGTWGINFWDWTDVRGPVLLNAMHLPQIEASDYTNGAWWLFWQAPYVYVGGSSRGLYVVDASDPSDPVLVAHVPNNATGGFRAGALFAVGNLLVVSMNDDRGIATLDISDPATPLLLDTTDLMSQYSTMVNGDRIILAGKSPNAGVQVFDIRDPSRIRFVDEIAMPDKGGYLVVQDDVVHVGDSFNGYFKIDISRPPYAILGRGDFTEGNTDLDFVSVVGNLAVLGDDHGNGTRLMPHQAVPDTTPPAVNMIDPKPNAANQAVTSRIGVTFTDLIDLRTVDARSFSVRSIGGPILAGTYSGQTGIVNFTPAAPLEPDTTYEVRIHAGGITDTVGNPTAADFVSFFSTGSEIALIDCDPMTTTPFALVGKPVGFDVTCHAEGLVYAWDFGDGGEALTSTPSVEHVYDAPGHYTVIVTVSDTIVHRTLTAAQTVINAPTEIPPAGASSIVRDDGRDRIWLVNPDADTIAAIDATMLVKVLEEPAGRDPRSIAIAPDGRVWVANRGDATIGRHAGSDGALLDEIPMPRASRPSGIAFSPTGDAAYVTLEAAGLLLALDPSTGSTLGAVDVGPRPRGIAVTHDGATVLVGRFVSPADHGEVVVVDASSMQVTRVVDLTPDPGPDTESSGRGIPNYLQSLSIAPDGHRVWVPAKKDNTARGVYVSGEPLTFESTSRAIVAGFDLAADAEDPLERADLDNRALPSAVAFNRLGDYAFVSTLASNTIDVLDAYTRSTVTSIEDVGLAPLGLAFDADSTRLFVHNYMSRDVVVYDVTDIGGGNDAPILATISTVETEPLDLDVLLGKQIFYNAADDRMSRDNYMSCAVCHLDGGSDGRTWDFTDRGEGVRQTVTLHGRAGLGHGPVHWSANFDEIQDFEHDVRGPFGGSGFMSDEDFFSGTTDTPLGDPKTGTSTELDVLAAYVASLDAVHPSPHRNADGTETPDAIAGAAISNRGDVGCAECHRAGPFTDSNLCASPFLLHDVGTITSASGQRLGEPLTGLDTPTLSGVWESAPYLHDGSAATLLDVITTSNPGDVHGQTSHLDERELLHLVAYLRELEDSGTTACFADVNGDCTAGFDDLVALLSSWGPCGAACPADVDRDGVVGLSDLIELLSRWGPCAA